MHAVSSFVTLTFSEENLPLDNSVNVRDVQLFMKRLRKSLATPGAAEDSTFIRFFACGEYGETLFRPHYHLIIFGHDFPDRYPWRKSPTGHPLYRSDSLEKLWPFGHSEIGTVTPQSAGYVARYCTKKVYGDDERARAHYMRGYALNPETGEERIWEVRREFIVMSRRPGIGMHWFQEFHMDCFPSDFVIVDGQKRPVPQAYWRRYLEQYSDENFGEGAKPLLNPAERVRLARAHKTRKHRDNNTDGRLLTRHESQQVRAKRLARNMDNDT